MPLVQPCVTRVMQCVRYPEELNNSTLLEGDPSYRRERFCKRDVMGESGGGQLGEG